MKSLYYRSQKISDTAFVSIAMTTLAVLAVVQWCRNETPTALRQQMIEAATQTDASFAAIRHHRSELGHRMLSSQDPTQTGMLGPSMSLVTTLPGHLDAKQTSINPNFAAVAVRLFHDAGVDPGDRVAIGMTGSFPALNIAVLQAARSMDLDVALVSSAASSQFGANHPEMMWPDMERILFDEGLIGQRSLATSLGGFRDAAVGMTDDTRSLLVDSVQRNRGVLLECESVADSIDQRMAMFDRSENGRPVVAYINVGGGSASVGGTKGNDALGSGVILPTQLTALSSEIDSVATRFLKRDIPVINMIEAVSLANRYGLAVQPDVRPNVGEANVYQASEYRRLWAATGILVVLMVTSLAVRPPRRWVAWIQRQKWWSAEEHQPQWMV
ncbi:hypothetical protein K227x_20410 [Rubripirellula lacrimiformis]|uniref:Poly-gamma-glutamate system protein n=1 Tax=Rubripirellula lacrimiformis TaxID=1930273 RepID=A0A517N939_9BACT|nr:poly-gamma-glutamate system protein [Rubripirellula lacrimiformis]QDT03657.1 hypothetical protein K227x_20410 [Rubripirellula lacrimiformis]